jgi:elongator complex protein 3
MQERLFKWILGFLVENSALISTDQLSRRIISRLAEIDNPTRHDVERIKLEVCREFNAERIPRNSEIIANLLPSEMKLHKILKRKLVRSISGVAIVAVMTPPSRCPHENAPCVYCPGGLDQGVPQSYTGKEPASMRGAQSNYDPYLQTRSRIEQLKAIGHNISKVELVIMGGTFPALSSDSQESYVKSCLDATNGQLSTDLEQAKSLAETAPIRNVGITVETRPDWAKQRHVDQMLKMGVTRVELGVQNIYDDIYLQVNRGHSVADAIEATQVLKDSGLKVLYHLMPGLPGSNFERDLEGFRKVFSEEDFRPDMLKIYPCLVIKGTKLYEWWREGKYKPYSSQEAADLIVEMKRYVPPWVRIMRVQRDIPATLIEDGVDRSDLRELVREKMKEKGVKCCCVRCREAGHRWLRDRVQATPSKIDIVHRSYEASNGKEFFISAEDTEQDILIGYVRLRIPSESAHRPEVAGKNASIIRELRVYGPMVPVGAKAGDAWQHRGYGQTLLKEAESISQVENRKKILVTSALGTKQYYHRLGYVPDGPYMSKTLGSN